MPNDKNEGEMAGTPESFEAKEYFEQYWRYSAAVRNWLVAFGVGCCVLLISEKAGNTMPPLSFSLPPSTEFLAHRRHRADGTAGPPGRGEGQGAVGQASTLSHDNLMA